VVPVDSISPAVPTNQNAHWLANESICRDDWKKEELAQNPQAVEFTITPKNYNFLKNIHITHFSTNERTF